MKATTTVVAAGLVSTVLCLLTAVVLRLASGGWSTLTLLIPNVVALIVHAALAALVLSRSPSSHQCMIVILSGVAFLFAIMFQTDYGDGSGVWFVFQGIVYSGSEDSVRIPTWWPLRGNDLKDIFLFVPCAVLWLLALLGLNQKQFRIMAEHK
ncbi:MAG: hypothetical protein ACK5YR_04885 [Pirellula sp.]